jgi:hypothetical protein
VPHACNRRGRIHRAARLLLAFPNSSTFSSRGLSVRTLHAHSTSLLLCAHPVPLAFAHHARLSRVARSHSSRSPIPRCSLPHVPHAARPDEPSVVVVLTRRWLRPRRLEMPGPDTPMLQACFKCFRCFICMFQVFHTDGAKVDQDVAYVAMVVYICCKCLFLMLHLFFQTYVTNVFIWMLHMFHTYVTSVLSGCCICLQLFFQVFFMCFCKCFRRMF